MATNFATAYLWGSSAAAGSLVTSAKIQNIRRRRNPIIDEKVVDEDGLPVHRRTDGVHTSLSATLRVTSAYTRITPGLSVAVTGDYAGTYIVTSDEDSGSAGQFRDFQVELDTDSTLTP